jgi:hypothetical protein
MGTVNRPTKKRPKESKNKQNEAEHGFYSKHMSRIEVSDLETALQDGLTDEIAMLRVALRRTFQLAKGAATLEDAETALSSLGFACTHLSGLLRTHKMLTGDSTTTNDVITTAISQVIMEMTK